MKNKKIVTGAMALLLATGTAVTSFAADDFSIDPNIDKKILDKIGTDDVVEFNPTESPIERDARLAKLDSKKASAVSSISALENLTKEEISGFTSRVKSAETEGAVDSLVSEARTLNSNKAPKVEEQPVEDEQPVEKEKPEEEQPEVEGKQEEEQPVEENKNYISFNVNGREVKVFGFSQEEVSELNLIFNDFFIVTKDGEVHKLKEATNLGPNAYVLDDSQINKDTEIDNNEKETETDENDKETETGDNEKETETDEDPDSEQEPEVDVDKQEQSVKDGEKEKTKVVGTQTNQKPSEQRVTITTSDKPVNKDNYTGAVRKASTNPKTGIEGTMAVAELLTLASATYFGTKKRR